VGDEIFFAFLQITTLNTPAGAPRVQTFFRVLRENTAADITDLLTKYFKNAY
jgi:hypothetical protein